MQNGKQRTKSERLADTEWLTKGRGTKTERNRK